MKNLNYTGLDAAKVQPVAELLQFSSQTSKYIMQTFATSTGMFKVLTSTLFTLNLNVSMMTQVKRLTKLQNVFFNLMWLLNIVPASTSKFLKSRKTKWYNCGQECLTQVLEMVKTLIAQERAILAAADEAGDESTNALMSDYLREQEKLVWMLTATLAKECSK